MDKEDVVGRVIHYFSILLPLSVITLSLVIMTNNPYGCIQIGGRGVIHAISAIGLGTSFIFIYNRLAYLYPLVRSIITLCFTVLSIHLYDFMWSLNKHIQLGYGFRLIPLLSVIVVGVLLERFDNKHGMLDITRTQIMKSVICFFIFVFAFFMMGTGGFYRSMELYELGLGSDPHVGSVGWVLGKLTVFWILIPLTQVADFKAPLRLDPKVLVW